MWRLFLFTLHLSHLYGYQWLSLGVWIYPYMALKGLVNLLIIHGVLDNVRGRFCGMSGYICMALCV